MTPAQMTAQVRSMLKQAGETVWARFPLATDFPRFRTAGLAATNALQLFGGPLLVMRDPCLRPMREAVLRANGTLVIPERAGVELLEIPASALQIPQDGSSAVLRIETAPPGSKPYCGPVQAVVVGCHAFDPLRRRVYGMDTCRTEYLLGELRDGLQNGWALPANVPVVVLASDAQQVQGWGDQGLAHEADFVVTSTRLIALGKGDTERIDGQGANYIMEGDEDE